MEFKEFCKNFKRMCNSVSCPECGINKTITRNKDLPDDCDSFCISYSDQAEPIVEQWAKENPVVTNADKFREVFGVELKSSERYDGYCLLTGNDGIAKDSEEWLNQEYKSRRWKDD